jgi:hypothetical protein
MTKETCQSTRKIRQGEDDMREVNAYKRRRIDGRKVKGIKEYHQTLLSQVLKGKS